MKRIITLTMPLLVSFGVVMAFALLEGQRQPDWQIELNESLGLL